MIERLINWLFERFQRACQHDPVYVTADIHEGGWFLAVEWCQRCGAVRGQGLEWRRPYATWTGENDRRARARDRRAA